MESHNCKGAIVSHEDQSMSREKGESKLGKNPNLTSEESIKPPKDSIDQYAKGESKLGKFGNQNRVGG